MPVTESVGRAARRRISLDARLPLGPVIERTVDHKHLFIDPDRACWLSLDAHEADVFRRLLRHRTLRAALNQEPRIDGQLASRVFARVVAAGFLGDRAKLLETSSVKQVQIHLTNRCNLRCVHCYMDSGVSVIPESRTEDWCRLITALADRYQRIFLSISGGEPLLSRSLFPVLEHAKASGIETAIITNGLLLRGKTLDRLNSLLDACAISLDGITPETHDTIRGEGKFAITYENLLGLADSPFRKILNITALRINREELASGLRDFVETLPIKVDIDLGSLVLEGRGVNRPDLALSPAEFRQLLLHIAQVFVADQALGERAVGTNGTVLWKSVPSRVRRSCGYGDSLVFYSNGGLSTCLTPRFIRGNIFQQAPGELLDAVERERAAAQVNRLEECRTCDLRHICGGRCHLPQLRAGQVPSQVECPQSYKDSMFRNLVAWGSSA